MVPITHDPQIQTRRSRAGWGLPALAVGALVLVVIALVAIPFASRPPELAPASTPEGVLQRFFDAIYRGDYLAAYTMLSNDTQHDLSLADFQARMRYQRESELRVDAVAIHGEMAMVSVTVTRYNPGDLFGGGEWSTQYNLLLERGGDTWRILGEPFW
jgi:hypothetical protein